MLDEEADGPENSEIKMKVCNIAQDIVYGVLNSKKLTQKHIELGLSLHQATRSENLVKLFHATNHVVGIEMIRRLDNAIAVNVFDKNVENGNVYIPGNFVAVPLIQFSC